ncbi:O-methyltransferase family protein [Abeliophyllum distichum]|uniref:O-methyltransferase family protein n=1 Tax=Abeliophyllum distichum TaxID=126358 RepID=A0ABD1PRL7_9LAMI
MRLDELVDALPNINKGKSHGVYRLMRILTHSGFFVDEKKGYLLTPAFCLHLKDAPYSTAPFVQAMLDPILTKPWEHVSEWLQNEHQTPFEIVHGRTCWEYVSHYPMLNHLFNDSMANDSRLVSSILVRDCKHVFEGLNSIVDAAGGTGNVARAIAEAFPSLKCIVLDLPHVVAGLVGTQNLSYVVGDMFESVPSADAILLKWVLHDWSDEDCVKILKKCKAAISNKDKGGKVIIIDIIMDNKKGDYEDVENQLFFDMLMMINTSGKERDEKEWAKLFQDAGFTRYKITHILGMRSIIEVYL